MDFAEEVATGIAMQTFSCLINRTGIPCVNCCFIWSQKLQFIHNEYLNTSLLGFPDETKEKQYLAN